MILGLTGGMGCGKSTATRFFRDVGFASIDSDAVIRDHILPDPTIEQAIQDKFGRNVMTAEKHVDRRALATIIFESNEALKWLEALLHPRLYGIWREQLTARPDADWVVEVPLLFEKALENWFDFTICVATTSTRQLARLAERGIPKALAEQRISKQFPLAQKLELADFVLSNDGSPVFLRDQIIGLVAQIGGLR